MFCENNDFVIWAACGLELCKSLKSDKPTGLPRARFSLFEST